MIVQYKDNFEQTFKTGKTRSDKIVENSEFIRLSKAAQVSGLPFIDDFIQ